MAQTPIPWAALLEATGLTGREVERRLGWAPVDAEGRSSKHGRISLILRGVHPTPTEEAQLLTLFQAVIRTRVQKLEETPD